MQGSELGNPVEEEKMATLSNQPAEIAAGEDRHHEFKQSIDNAESIVGEIVAFANSEGGILYIGIKDDGQVEGLKNPETVFQTLANICRDRCIPPVSPILEQYAIENKDIVLPEKTRIRIFLTGMRLPEDCLRSPPQLIQVTERLNRENSGRELKGLVSGRQFIGNAEGLLLIDTAEQGLDIPRWIRVMAVREWLMEK